MAFGRDLIFQRCSVFMSETTPSNQMMTDVWQQTSKPVEEIHDSKEVNWFRFFERRLKTFMVASIENVTMKHLMMDNTSVIL